jgi:peptidoglycan/xylan/chitin deacetylase (PgdA/CDA1 family)
MTAEWVSTKLGYLSGLRNGGGKREGVRVFCYHGVIERKSDRLERNLQLLSDFQAHVRFLKRFRVLSLTELAAELSANTKDNKPAAVITFDDGFANNLLAAEILGAHHLPWTVFIATGAVGRENSIWTVELSLLLLHGEAERIEVLDNCWPLNSRDEREAAFQSIRFPLKAMPADLRRQTMECIRQQFPQGENRRLLEKFPSLQMLSWDEVRQLAGAGVEIGSHGVNHEIHNPAQPETIRRFELVQSRLELERQLDRSCTFFAFPNGDCTMGSSDDVRAAGYRLAFTTQASTVLPGANPFMLPRLVPYGPLRTFARNFFWEPASAGSSLNYARVAKSTAVR